MKFADFSIFKLASSVALSTFTMHLLYFYLFFFIVIYFLFYLFIFFPGCFIYLFIFF